VSELGETITAEATCGLPDWVYTIAVDPDGTAWGFETDAWWHTGRKCWLAAGAGRVTMIAKRIMGEGGEVSSVPPEVACTMRFVRATED
jgi:hypothetical protein